MSKFDYFFSAHPAVKAELESLGIKLEQSGDPDDLWPCLVLPSGAILHIASDDEGNGPGAIHVEGANE